MIILFSFEGNRSTNRLIEWLEYYECRYKRINLPDEDFSGLRVTGKDSITLTLELKSGEKIDFSSVDFFYVRGRGFVKGLIENKNIIPNKIYKEFLSKEYSSLVTYFYSYVNNKSLGCFAYSPNLNKLNQLKVALEVGLSIPPI